MSTSKRLKRRTVVKNGHPSIFQWAGILRPATLGLCMMLALVLASGLSVVLTTHENRFAFNELQELRELANKMELEWGQLLIEQSTFGVEGKIEQKAVEQLQMHVPDLSKIVMVSHE